MKILYNVTIKIETTIQEEWLEWMKNVHIPDVLATECFESYRLTRILGDDDEHGVGFAIQYVEVESSLSKCNNPTESDAPSESIATLPFGFL
jgi:hypothetical protein